MTRAQFGEDSCSGGISEAVGALGLGRAGEIFRRALERGGPDGFELVKRAADLVRRSLAAEGLTPGAIGVFLRRNPHGQLRTEFPKVADIVDHVERTVRMRLPAKAAVSSAPAAASNERAPATAPGS
ncbi:hypothetical protein [Burkholderia cenocepacia]|uniref:Uncharacterized protein n=1 Tax=Burkholderia cenocepacia TaxID=95486 RepID=A0AAD0J3Z4_9BURK|nr:hypothetical protein [Burkholderia cenocepacia]AWG30951.1 hypothetical protein B9Z07_18965 [Burkholderia cenocepacia]PRE38611.1 hypothetical protein C6P63_01625 [Burkholderia cenocepacia]HEM7885792.1 hypothetical protein [Burkholderia cenocepacia]